MASVFEATIYSEMILMQLHIYIDFYRPMSRVDSNYFYYYLKQIRSCNKYKKTKHNFNQFSKKIYHNQSIMCNKLIISNRPYFLASVGIFIAKDRVRIILYTILSKVSLRLFIHSYLLLIYLLFFYF